MEGSLEQLMSSASEKLLLVMFFSVAVYFLLDFKSRIEKSADKNKEAAEKNTKRNEVIYQYLKREIDSHKTAMGNATKAINGDFINLQKTVVSVEKLIYEELNKTKGQITLSQEKNKKNNKDLVKVFTHFDRKYGDVIKLAHAIDSANGRIIEIEKLSQFAADNSNKVSQELQRMVSMIKKAKSNTE